MCSTNTGTHGQLCSLFEKPGAKFTDDALYSHYKYEVINDVLGNNLSLCWESNEMQKYILLEGTVLNIRSGYT
jgi:hypothetical protein